MAHWAKRPALAAASEADKRLTCCYCKTFHCTSSVRVNKNTKGPGCWATLGTHRTKWKAKSCSCGCECGVRQRHVVKARALLTAHSGATATITRGAKLEGALSSVQLAINAFAFTTHKKCWGVLGVSSWQRLVTGRQWHYKQKYPF